MNNTGINKYNHANSIVDNGLQTVSKDLARIKTKQISLLVEFTDGDSLITKFNGKVKQAVQYYHKNNALSATGTAKVKKISVLGKKRVFPINLKLHGEIVDRRFDPYHGVTVYEDGFEDKFYVGE